jgi:hypothetical protein
VAPANSAGFDAATATPGLRMDVKRRPNKNTKPLFQTTAVVLFSLAFSNIRAHFFLGNF